MTTNDFLYLCIPLVAEVFLDIEVLIGTELDRVDPTLVLSVLVYTSKLIERPNLPIFIDLFY